MLSNLTLLIRRFSMYQLMYYFLWLLFAVAILLSFTGHLPYDPGNILVSGVYLVIICYVANILFAKLYAAKPKPYSATITALILALIVGPLPLIPNLLPLTLLGAIAMASKYVLAVGRRHPFNPAAFAVLITAFLFNLGASWWVGLNTLLPLIVFGGAVVVFRAIKGPSVIAFLLVSLLTSVVTQTPLSPWIVTAPIWFFALVMLVEPLTSPTAKKPQLAYGALVGASYGLLPGLWPTYPFPLETSLLIGNLFSFALFHYNRNRTRP